MAILKLVFGRELLGTHDLDRDKFIIGRSDDCDIVVDNLAVSRHHAIIEKIDGVFSINDLDSNNGTFVNGQRINEPTALNFGDEVGIGKHILVFDSHTRKNWSVQTQPHGEALRDMDSTGRGTMFISPDQMDKMQEKVVATRKAHLEVPGSQNGMIILDKKDVIFGKASNCDVRVSGLFVSRRHAMLSRLEKGSQLTNFAIFSPTRVNGIVIDSALLCDGDEIRIGRNRFIFRSGQ